MRPYAFPPQTPTAYRRANVRDSSSSRPSTVPYPTPGGWTAGPSLRALRTERTTAVKQGKQQAMAALAGGVQQVYFGGDLEAGVALTGEVAGRIESIEPTRNLFLKTVPRVCSWRLKKQGNPSLRTGKNSTTHTQFCFKTVNSICSWRLNIQGNPPLRTGKHNTTCPHFFSRQQLAFAPGD